jgi:nitrogen fixation NifU-like protein
LGERSKEEAGRGMSEFDEGIEQIKAATIENGRKAEKAIEKWLRYMGEMEDPQGHGKITGPCGDTVEIFLQIHDDTITDARFTTDGCLTTIAAGSMACELVIGKDVRGAFKVSKEVILERLGGLPEDGVHCALLTSNTLREALTDHLTSKKEPWRRLYKKH